MFWNPLGKAARRHSWVHCAGNWGFEPGWARASLAPRWHLRRWLSASWGFLCGVPFRRKNTFPFQVRHFSRRKPQCQTFPEKTGTRRGMLGHRGTRTPLEPGTGSGKGHWAPKETGLLQQGQAAETSVKADNRSASWNSSRTAVKSRKYGQGRGRKLQMRKESSVPLLPSPKLAGIMDAAGVINEVSISQNYKGPAGFFLPCASPLPPVWVQAPSKWGWNTAPSHGGCMPQQACSPPATSKADPDPGPTKLLPRLSFGLL